MLRFLVASRAQLQVSEMDLHRHAEFSCGWTRFMNSVASVFVRS